MYDNIFYIFEILSLRHFILLSDSDVPSKDGLFKIICTFLDFVLPRESSGDSSASSSSSINSATEVDYACSEDSHFVAMRLLLVLVD